MGSVGKGEGRAGEGGGSITGAAGGLLAEAIMVLFCDSALVGRVDEVEGDVGNEGDDDGNGVVPFRHINEAGFGNTPSIYL